jgi:hypothetical protein
LFEIKKKHPTKIIQKYTVKREESVLSQRTPMTSDLVIMQGSHGEKNEMTAEATLIPL